MNLKALVLLIAGHFVTDINTGALPAFLPFIKESLNLSYTVTASIILVFNVTSFDPYQHQMVSEKSLSRV